MKWLSLSACAGEDPKIFDAFSYPSANEAMRICGNCTVVKECFAWVKPNKSFYDGVAGGIVWRNGYRVRINNTSREDRILELRGKSKVKPTSLPEMDGQRTLPFI